MNEVNFSPGVDCKNAIIENIQQATKSISVCVFTISDNDISDALIAAFQKGINVQIITDDDKTKDKGSDIEFLFKAGIPIRTDDKPSHMHHKFAVVDDTILITGSFNWTRSASERNHENIIVTDNEPLVSQHKNYFEDLWTQMKRYY